ncbi:MAG TPA: hypothetical protein VGZ47_05215 [Gemmataceae bacterium]|jgi:hypothetical protein|nr:hypothetical protein [Gemmataceae bacterium]
MKAEVVYLFAFDVANEIATEKIQSVLSEQPQPFDIQTDHTFPRDVPLHKPLTVEPKLTATLNGRALRAVVRIYEVGAITIALRVALEAVNLRDLLPFHKPQLGDDLILDALARRLCGQVRESLQDLLINPAPTSEPEAYTAFCITEMEGVNDVNAWLTEHRREVAGLLTETAPERLSEAQIGEVLRLQRSFENCDVVVIDWDAALVVDLAGYVEDTLYLLELANLQLEEFRAMDRALDGYLNRAYDDLERKSFSLFGITSPVLRLLRQHRVDLTKLADEVTNITKFFGDWHLARVYVAARERFYLEQWRGSVDRRLAQLDQLYGVVQSEVYGQRMFWLEVIIVIFFAIDLFAILVLKR